MRSFKVGDKVIYSLRGYCFVQHIEPRDLYPVKVAFPDGKKKTFTVDGRFENADLFPSLFHEDEYPTCYPQYEKPKPDLKVDAKLIVWDSSEYKHYKCRAHFKEWGKDGKVVCFDGGRTSHTDNGDTCVWNHYEIVEC